jgi:hypothetical protein
MSIDYIANFPLSDEVLIAYIAKSNVSNGHFKQVMVENSPVNDPVRPFLNTRLTYLPSGIANQIRAAAVDNGGQDTPAKLIIEKEALELDRSALFSLLVGSYLEDEDIVGLINLLDTENTPEANRQLTDIYLALEDIGNASIAVSNVNAISSEELNWEVLSQLQLDLLNQNKAITDIDSLQKDQISNLVTLYPEDPSTSRAKAWLRLASQLDYPLYLPVANKSFSDWNNYTPSEADVTDDDFSIYPNPAKDHLFITGSFNESDRMSVEVFDVSGRVIFSKSSSGNVGLLEVNLVDISVGTYSYRIMKNNETVKSERLIIVQ